MCLKVEEAKERLVRVRPAIAKHTATIRFLLVLPTIRQTKREVIGKHFKYNICSTVINSICNLHTKMKEAKSCKFASWMNSNCQWIQLRQLKNQCRHLLGGASHLLQFLPHFLKLHPGVTQLRHHEHHSSVRRAAAFFSARHT